MKWSIVTGIVLLAAITGAGYYLWQDREIVFENTTATTPLAQSPQESPAASTTSATSTGPEKRENIFEYPDQESAQKTENASKPEKKSAPMQTTVTYTESGWSPAVAVVAEGGMVTFVNKSGKPFQPAANPHPAHTSYDGFDAKKGIAIGGSFAFTFEKPGTIGYHDHLSPEKIGVINIE